MLPPKDRLTTGLARVARRLGRQFADRQTGQIV